MYSGGEQPVSLGETLVKAGYAKLVNWGLEMMSVNAFNLKEAERNAKQQRVGIWRNYVAPATAGQLVVLTLYVSYCKCIALPHIALLHCAICVHASTPVCCVGRFRNQNIVNSYSSAAVSV